MIKIYQLNFEGEETCVGTIQGGKTKMTKEQEQYIKDNYKTTTRQEMAHQIGRSKTIVDRFMRENNLRIIKPKKSPIKENEEYVKLIKENYKTKTIKELSQMIGYSEESIRSYVALNYNKEDETMKELRADLKNYYTYIKNLFDNNKVVAGRVNINFKELMALARLKKEGLIKLVKEKTGQYTVILN